MHSTSSARLVRRRSLLCGVVASVGVALLAACGREPSEAADAPNASPTAAPTRVPLISTPLATLDLSVTPTAIPPRRAQILLRIVEVPGVQQLKIPGSIAFDPRGLIHITERGGGDRVLVFDGSGRFVRSWGASGTGDGQFLFSSNPSVAVSPIAIAADGTIYIGDTTGRIQIFDGSGRFLRAWGGPGGSDELGRPGGMAIDGRDTLHIADADTHRIQMFDRNGRYSGSWGGPGAGPGQFNSPKEIHLDREGKFFIADEGNNRIQVFDHNRQFVRSLGRYGSGEGEFALLRGVETDRRGDIYVPDKNNDRIQKFTADGQFITQWGPSAAVEDKLVSPNEVRVDVHGNVWVATGSFSDIRIYKQ